METIVAALVNGAIAGCVMAVLGAAGLGAASRRRLNAATRYAAWWTLLAAVVCLPVLFLPRPAGTRIVADSVPVPAVRISTLQTARVTPLPALARRSKAAPVFRLELPGGHWTVWVLAGWAVASGLMLARLLLSCLLLEREKRRAAAAPGGLAEEWLGQCGCRRRGVRLAACRGIGTPVAAGLWRPAILIPARLFEHLNEREIHQIGLHEAAHLARFDDYALLLERVLEALWVWHPAVRWIARRLDLEREIACDDLVVKLTGEGRAYAACLTRVVALTGGVRGSLAAAAAAEERSHLSRRVDMLLDSRRNPAARLSKYRFLAMAGMMAILVYAVARLPVPVAFAMQQRPTAPAIAIPAATVPAAPAAQIAPAPVPAPAPAPRAVTAPDDIVVKVPVVVLDPMHRAVTGLARQNFRIFDDGVEQQVAEFTTAETATSFGIVFDASGSTASGRDAARRAVAQFVNGVAIGSEFCLVEVHESAAVTSGFTSDASGLLASLDGVKAHGGTALWEAIVLALQEMKQARNAQKALLIVSDGVDNTSRITASEAIDAARAAGIPISAISLGDDRRGKAFLDELTGATGGRVIAGENPANAGAAAAVATRNLYMLVYHSTNSARDGSFRKLRVEVTAPVGIPPLTLRYRSGYYAQ